MAGKKSSSVTSERLKSGKKSNNRNGGRRSSREVVIVQQRSSSGLYAVIIVLTAIIVVGGTIGTLLYLDVRDQKAGTTGNAPQNQGPDIPALESAAKANPSSVDAQLALGHGYIDTRQIPKAKDNYAAILKTDPNNHEALNHMGLVMVAEGKLDQALTYYDKAIAQNVPDKAHVTWDKASLLMEMKRYKDAIAAWQQVMALPQIKGTADEETARARMVQAQQALSAAPAR